MVVSVKTIPKSQIVQEDQPHANLVFSDQEGVRYNPNPDIEDQQDAYFEHNIAPSVQGNFAWNQIKLNWTRNYTSTPSIFEALFTLHGILLDGTMDLLGEKIVTAITGTEMTEDLIFDLYSSRSTPSFRKIPGTAPSGKIQLNLPMRWLNFESVQLRRSWLEGWTRRKRIPVTNTSSTLYPGYTLRRISVAYDSDMKTDFSDIRFTDRDGRTFLCYDRDSYITGTSAVFNVLVPNLGNGEARTIYLYYGNSGASYAGNPFNLYEYYDDFEDGKYTGRSSPYVNWTPYVGTLGIESASPISGSYSLKHTGTAAPDNFSYFPIPSGFNNNYRVDYDFKLNSQGSGNSAVPYIMLWWKRLDANNNIRAYAYYTGTNTNIKVRMIVSGSTTDVADVLWLSGSKIPTDTKYHFALEDTGTNLKIYIDDTLRLNTSYSFSPTPTNFGVGMNYSGVAVFDNLKLGYHNPNVSYGSLGSEESTITISPDTPSEDDTSILYSTPADWTGADNAYLRTTPLGHSSYDTNDVLVSPLNVLEHGFNALDPYVGMKLGMYLQADPKVNMRINSMSYAYEEVKT